MGPANTIFGFGGGGGWGWPYYGGYPPYYRPQAYEWVCRWEENPPTEDTNLICTQEPVRYPVAWGPPGWGW
jgi:hypothetical protein